MKRWLLGSICLVVATVLVPPMGSAAALTCTAAPMPVQRPLPQIPVTPVLSWLQAGVCAPGPTFVSIAPACPPAPFVGAVPGAFCGPVIPAGGIAICQWTPLTPDRLGLYAGYDYNGNGDILAAPDGETPVWGPMLPFFLSWIVPNPGPLPGRLIAYPTNLGGVGPLLGAGELVMCV